MDIASLLKPLLEAAAGAYGPVAQVLAVLVVIVGAARLIVKPLRELAQVVVGLTKTKSDDELLKKVEGSKITKALVFLADLLFSLKLPAPKAPEQK